MQTLRQAHQIARFVLVWFALSLGAAIASPLVKAQAVELICSGSGGMKLLLKNDAGGETGSVHTLDCSLCASSDAPPPGTPSCAGCVQPLAYVMQGLPTVQPTSLAGAVPPARGPPTLS